MEKVLANVLTKIKPSKKEEERVRNFVSEIMRVSKSLSGKDVAIVGSIGKYTWLAGDHDVDVFIMFPKETNREDLEKQGLEIGKKIVEHMHGRGVVKYAEHPYTSAVIRGFDVDIVPCYKIHKGEHIQSAVDRSPLHLQYVLDHLSPKMQDQVRLLKQFCKGIGVYGSDAKNLGFSGYICELLILYYDSFEKVMAAAAAWQAPQVIDIAGFGEKSRFAGQPLIIVDPVDKNRNAAAVVSVGNFVVFSAMTKKFMEKPDVSFFSPKPITPLLPKQLKYLGGRGTKFIAVKIKKPDAVDDVLYPQLRKALKRLDTLMHHNEFSVLRSYEFTGKECYLIFELEVFELPPIDDQDGPPIFAKHHVGEFLAKYKGKNFVYIDEDRLVAEVKRTVRDPVRLLSSFMGQEKEKLIENGIPSYIAAESASMKIFEQQKFFSHLKSNKELSDFMRIKYFEDLGKIL